jgi:hypothetical protein
MTTQIRRTQIIGTNIVVFSAWEPSVLMGAHSNLTSDGNGNWIGRIGTNRNLPSEIETLPPGSDARIDAVRGWYDAQYERAYNLIITAHPEAANGTRRSGEIEIRV